MKRYLQIGITFSMVMLFVSIGLEAASIEGVWRNSKTNIQMEVEQTYTGIKTKRFDQNDWFYYDKSGNNRYKDYRGNEYRFRNQGELEWKSADGRRKLSFRKVYVTNDRDRYNDRNRDRDRYNDRDRDRDRYNDRGYFDYDDYEYGSCDYTCTNPAHNHPHLNLDRYFSDLRGTWYDQRNGQRVRVKVEKRYIKLKVYDRWIKFRPQSPYSFSDGRGTLLTVMSDGRLRLKNRNRYRTSLLSKRRPVVSYCY